VSDCNYQERSGSSGCNAAGKVSGSPGHCGTKAKICAAKYSRNQLRIVLLVAEGITKQVQPAIIDRLR
jgi:hypothetical protein